ncbi:MAG: hypothetical protein KAI66_24905 [Lentisphaeria bacterium]|nr:hypothetical protein [Lentisphaeria bacterium]
MKNAILVVGIIAVTVSCLVGCGKKKNAEAEALEQAEMAAMDAQLKTEAQDIKKTVSEVTSQAEKQVAEAKKAADELVAQATGETQKAEAAAQKAKADLAALQTKFDTLVANVKATIGEKNYQAALTKLQEGLQLENLTAEQENTLKGLIDTVKKAMTSDAGAEAKKALGGFLKR